MGLGQYVSKVGVARCVELTQMNVAGRKIKVIAAIVFMEELSRSVASAIRCEFVAKSMVAFVSR